MTQVQTDTARDEIAALASTFDRLYLEKRRTLVSAETGKIIVINVKTGEHVIARTSDAAMNLAEEQFGSTDWCWARRID